MPPKMDARAVPPSSERILTTHIGSLPRPLICEHLEVVAQRIKRYADAVGRENAIASSGCGFAALSIGDGVHPKIA